MFSSLQLGIYAAMALGAIGVIVVAYFKGKSSNEAKHVKADLKETKRLEEAAMAPRPTTTAVRDSMSDGTF